MKLHEIIEHVLEMDASQNIGYHVIQPYKKSLKVYLENYWCGAEIVFMATSVTNNSCYGQLVTAHELYEAIENYINECDDLNNDDKEHIRELIPYQSFTL